MDSWWSAAPSSKPGWSSAFPPSGPLPNEVTEADELYQNAGEKGRKHADPLDPPRRRANKTRGHGNWESERVPIAGVVGRDSGQIRLQVCKHSARATLQPFVEAQTRAEATVTPDEWQAYDRLPETGRSHPTVCHTPGTKLRHERRLDTSILATAIQRDEPEARNVLERLVEAGLVEARGVARGRTYTLSPRVYRELGQPADYIWQAGFDPIQQEQMVLQYVKNHSAITRQEAMSLCRISEDQATRLLTRLQAGGKLQRKGRGRAAAYSEPDARD